MKLSLCLPILAAALGLAGCGRHSSRDESKLDVKVVFSQASGNSLSFDTGYGIYSFVEKYVLSIDCDGFTQPARYEFNADGLTSTLSLSPALTGCRSSVESMTIETYRDPAGTRVTLDFLPVSPELDHSDLTDGFRTLRATNGETIRIKLELPGTLASQMAGQPSILQLNYLYSMVQNASGKNSVASGSGGTSTFMAVNGIPLPSIDPAQVGLDLTSGGVALTYLHVAAGTSVFSPICGGFKVMMAVRPKLFGDYLTNGTYPDYLDLAAEGTVVNNWSVSKSNEDPAPLAVSGTTALATDVMTKCAQKTVSMQAAVGCVSEAEGLASYFLIDVNVYLPNSVIAYQDSSLTYMCQ